MLQAVALAVLFLAAQTNAKVPLDGVGLYGTQWRAQRCLDAIWESATIHITQLKASANCLRMAFHDAGTYNVDSDEGGANGSILRELNATQNSGFVRCPPALDLIRADVNSTRGCQNTSMADIIQVAGAVSVYLAGGPACAMTMGRVDLANGTDNPANLPSPCHNVSQLLAGFAANGFADPAQSLLVLSGAHNIGFSDGGFPTGLCSHGAGPFPGNGKFDGHYYQYLGVPYDNGTIPMQGGQGFFLSDNELAMGGDDQCAQGVADYVQDPSLFIEDWCPAYQEMSMLGVDDTYSFGPMLPRSYLMKCRKLATKKTLARA